MEERALETDARRSGQASMDSMLRGDAVGDASAGQARRFCRDAARLAYAGHGEYWVGVGVDRGGGERSLGGSREHQGRSDWGRLARGRCAVGVGSACVEERQTRIFWSAGSVEARRRPAAGVGVDDRLRGERLRDACCVVWLAPLDALTDVDLRKQDLNDRRPACPLAASTVWCARLALRDGFCRVDGDAASPGAGRAPATAYA